MSDASLQRRASRFVVRVQARAEAGQADRWAPFLLAGLVSLVFAVVATARNRSLDAGLDLAGYSQATWLIGQGYRPETSLFGTEVHVLELHWSFVLYPLAMVSKVIDVVDVLLVSQSVAIGLTVVPLWWLCRRVCRLRFGATLALALAFCLHPGIHQIVVNDFHPEALATPAFVGMAYASAARRWGLYWICVVFVLACRADLGLTVAAWGLLLIVDGRRRAGLWSTGIAAFWSLGLLLVLQPILGNASGGQYGEYGDSLGEALVTMLSNPGQFFGDLFDRANVLVLLGLLAPILFLPLLSLRYFLPAVPLGAVFLVTSVTDSAITDRTSMLLAFAFIASAYALSRLGVLGVDRVFVDVRVLATLVAASFISYAATSPLAPYDAPWDWGQRDDADEGVLEAVAWLSPSTAVRSSPTGLSNLSMRPWLYSLATDQQPQVASAVYRVRAVLIDERTLPELEPEARAEQREAFAAAMAAQGYELVVDRSDVGVLLFYRE